ncbi:MAG: anti-sigma factor [Burkholderiales bacterium]|nr:anti-sigma factor [Burkholderiales bacterium]
MDYAHDRLADALAAQYVTGTLRHGARRRFESLLTGHPTLRGAVHDWQERLMPLAASVTPVPPPPRVWRAIEGRLWPDAKGTHGAQPIGAAAGWWQRLGLWRGLSGLATAAVLVLTVALVRTPPAVPPIVVVLEGQAGTPAAGATFVASVSGDGQAMVMQPVSATLALQSDRVLELWSVPPQGAPRSLGLVSASGATVLPRSRLPETLLKGGTAALAVSVEPPGGSPTGAPTGPVVFAGKLRI